MKTKIVFPIIIFFLLIIIGAFKVRKDFPYDIEVVPADRSCFLVNITDWADRDLDIRVESSDGLISETIFPGVEKVIKVGSLNNEQSYNIRISRKDLIGKIRYRTLTKNVTPSEKIDNYIVLIGASVGKSWELNNFADRTESKDSFYGYRGAYTFDKTSVIENLLESQIKPTAVIIKECAAYFPRKAGQSIKKVREWTDLLVKYDIKPVLATVVPVTADHDRTKANKRMSSINEFNNEIRALGKEKKIPVLDLQQALSDGSSENYLDKKFAVPDGLHLKKETYANKLDKLLNDFVKSKLK